MRILLAPMEGLLDHLLRDTLTQPGGGAITSSGIDACVTEFIRVTNTLLPAERFHRVVPELGNRGRTPSGVPVRVQFLGSDPACMAENAAHVAALGALGVDLNFGCPAKLVNRHGGGAALLRDPDLMRAIVRAVRQAVPAGIPVTAKMRLGYDTPNRALECAEALADGGAAEIDTLARGEHERAHTRAGGSLLELADDVEASRSQAVVDGQLDRDRPHEVVALLAGVLTRRLGEFGHEGIFDLVEAGVVDGAQHHGEVVGHDAAALDVDGSLVVHLAHETAPEFDGADRALGAAKEHAIDHTLQTVLE